LHLELIRKNLDYYETVTSCRGQTSAPGKRYTKKHKE
jgi:hypothetical protein